MTARDFSKAKNGSDFIAPFSYKIRNPNKMYITESKCTEQHRRAPVVGLLMTYDAEECSKTLR